MERDRIRILSMEGVIALNLWLYLGVVVVQASFAAYAL